MVAGTVVVELPAVSQRPEECEGQEPRTADAPTPAEAPAQTPPEGRTHI